MHLPAANEIAFNKNAEISKWKTRTKRKYIMILSNVIHAKVESKKKCITAAMMVQDTSLRNALCLSESSKAMQRNEMYNASSVVDKPRRIWLGLLERRSLLEAH